MLRRSLVCFVLGSAILFTASCNSTPNPAQTPKHTGQISYTTSISDNMQVFLYDPATQKTLNLVDKPTDNLWPSWNPDGNLMAYTSARTGNMDVYVLNVNAETITNLTNNPADDGWPAWSPDGNWIAFASSRT